MGYLETIPKWFLAVWLGILGASIGSFLNVVIYRFPREISLIKPGSHCFSCERKIKPWNNIPIISWILLRGKCPDCGSGISIRYMIVELLGSAVAVYSYTKYGLSWDSLGGMLLGWHLIVLAFIDLDTWTIPDHITLSLGLSGLIIGFLGKGVSGLLSAALGALSGIVFLLLVVFIAKLILRQKEGIGGGDFTMIAGYGTFLAHPLVVAFSLVTASMVGIIAAIVQVFVKKENIREKKLPFGPWLAIGAWVAYFYGTLGIDLYLNWAFH